MIVAQQGRKLSLAAGTVCLKFQKYAADAKKKKKKLRKMFLTGYQSLLLM